MHPHFEFGPAGSPPAAAALLAALEREGVSSTSGTEGQPPFPGAAGLATLQEEVFALCVAENLPRLRQELAAESAEGQWRYLLEARTFLRNGAGGARPSQDDSPHPCRTSKGATPTRKSAGAQFVIPDDAAPAPASSGGEGREQRSFPVYAARV